MQIDGWSEHGIEQTIRPVWDRHDAVALQAAVDAARASDGGGSELLWRQDRAHPLVRNAARLVLGLGSVVVVGLAMVVAVAGAGAGVLAALIGFVVVGGSFVAFIWRIDVGIEIYGDGRLVRSGWGGIETHDLRTFRRVTVGERSGPLPGDVDGA